jgi:hypothetical protein
MRLLPRVLWIIAFLLATFCWMVVFQHGLSWQGFRSGAHEEWHVLVSTVMGSKP